MLRLVYCFAALLAAYPVVLVAAVPQFGIPGSEFLLEFVSVGNPGNGAHTLGSSAELGAVPYSFEMGKFEVSEDMIQQANAASAVDGTGGDLMLDVFDLADFGGNAPEKPASGITWNEAARFVNWLNIGTGYHPAYNFPTAPGDDGYAPAAENVELWPLSSPGYSEANPMRSTLARYVIPTLDEWFKSAFHNADVGQESIYFGYATGSNAPPTAVSAGTGEEEAVYNQPREQGPAPVDQSGGPSPYGTIGQSGNIAEWVESYPRGISNSITGEANQATIAGGSWTAFANFISAEEGRVGLTTLGGNFNVGFRVAMLPEVTPLPVGDFSMDTLLSDEDIDLLSEQVVMEINTPRFDLNDDGLVNSADRMSWVEELAATSFGDADLNGTVEFADFLQLSANFNQETGWAGGDFDGNGTAEFADFLLLSDNFGKTAVAAVPEPSAGLMLGWMMACVGFAGRRRASKAE